MRMAAEAQANYKLANTTFHSTKQSSTAKTKTVSRERVGNDDFGKQVAMHQLQAQNLLERQKAEKGPGAHRGRS